MKKTQPMRPMYAYGAVTSVIAVLIGATPATAQQIDLDIGGFFRGYAVALDQDAPAGEDPETFDFRRDSEIHIKGETTLDNGLTVGVAAEFELGFTPGTNFTDETYLYFSGDWGRVTLGSEHGIAYTLQVVAPSADSNIDGMRPYIQAFATDLYNDDTMDGDFAARLTYSHVDSSDTDRITYVTPKFNGFQAGVSYAPEPGQNAPNDGFANPGLDNAPGGFEHMWETAARWDGEWRGLGLSVGAGYSHVSLEAPSASISSDRRTWNVGASVAVREISFGAAYRDIENENGAGLDVDNDVYALGLAWDRGPYHLGASYFNSSTDTETVGDARIERVTAGGGYTIAPGMSLRGTVAHVMTGGLFDGYEQTQVAIGTDIKF